MPHSNQRTWNQWWKSFRFPAIVIAIIVTVAGSLMYAQNTLVSGTELNAANWELRNFHFRRDPLTNWQITSIRYSAARRSGAWISQNDVTSVPDPVIAGYLNSANRSADRWDLVRFVDSSTSLGRAAILVELMDLQSSQLSSDYWVQWSTKEPKKAAVFWPAAHGLVASEQYTKLPDLFEIAIYEPDQDEFVAAVAALLARSTDTE
ncbi:MAG: hypothetical protein R3C53_06430 [Pirellulaceae bacterium]